jgi:hypothetical protein
MQHQETRKVTIFGRFTLRDRKGRMVLPEETGTSSIDSAQLRRFCLKTETESSLRNVVSCNVNRTVFLGKDRARWIIFVTF